MDLMTGALALSYDDARTTGRTTAPGDEAPRVILKMETIGPLYSSTAWRLPRAYTPLTPEERAEYYKAYDPMTGVKIAATLSGLLTMAVLYVFYKAKCRRLKYFRRSSSDADNVSQPPAPQQQQPRHERINNEPASPKSVVHLADEVCQRSRINSESGRDTPAGSVSTHASNTARTHYYLDDRDMPPWKIYAKELFLYGGPGLWRSASLKGSDPLLLVAQSSFDETFAGRSQLRTCSLSGSMTGGLTCPSRKASVVGPGLCSSRLQVPDAVGPYGRQRLRLNGRQLTEDHKCFAERSSKKMPARSVSFRENEATKMERKRLARSRPGSLRAQSDCGYRGSFRLPRRHLSTAEGRLLGETEPGPAAQRPGTRIPAGVSRKVSRSKSLHVRSSSLGNEAARSIRSRLSKIMRAKSSAGDPGFDETRPVESEARDARPQTSYAGLIDICVIQATPAASPCASIRSTFSGDSIELGLKPPSACVSIKTSMSVRDRRRCFANMKGQTIDHDHETAIDPAYLAPPTSDFQMTGTSSSRLAGARHLLDVHHQQDAKGKCVTASAKSAGGSSKSLTADLYGASPTSTSFD